MVDTHYLHRSRTVIVIIIIIILPYRTAAFARQITTFMTVNLTVIPDWSTEYCLDEKGLRSHVDSFPNVYCCSHYFRFVMLVMLSRTGPSLSN